MFSSGAPVPSNPSKRPRQEPISCQFCRSKKLKCNRQHPCSNCASRGLACDGKFVSPGRRPPALVDDPDDQSVLARLKRLEDIVIGRTPIKETTGTGPEISSSVALSRTIPSPSVACLSPASEYEQAVQNLEGTGVGPVPWVLPRGHDIRMVSIRQISLEAAKTFHSQSTSNCLCLPPRAEASLLLDHYFQHIDDLQHVVHVPTVRNMMQNLYANLEQGLPILPSELALLLSILASSSNLAMYFLGDIEPSFSASDVAQASSLWINTTLEVIESSRRTTPSQLEDVQAAIILGFLLFHSEGFSTRARHLFAGAVIMARDLSLHKTDAPGSAGSQRAVLETEIKRRVWWHVVATDWFLGLSGGPQEGTYFVQPRHIRVNKPMNVNDEDLREGTVPIDKPLSEPTIMSYYIQRIKLADICRSVVDLMPLSSLELGTVDYQDVIRLDSKFESFLQELPSFFKIDEHHIRESEPVMRRYPRMQVQRLTLGMIGHTRRCKLHQPFLIRRAVQRHYDYSRHISLKSARAVIRMKTLIRLDEPGSFMAAVAKNTGVVYHIFMATIVLVMDLCFNEAAEGEDDAARKAEVAEACRMLEEAKSQSGMAHEFLESLLDVLRKHKVHLQASDLPAPRAASEPSAQQLVQPPIPLDPGGQQAPPPYDSTWGSEDISQHYLSDFDEIWKEYVELGPKMGMPSWDSLFSDLDSRM
ncbi:putative Zn(II)2Cys6 transcription factor [Fonsecaea pedrosoi]|nr:putative Zn(II)2Cys6 transcription factor [Fonsecaea pedrosoi]